VKGASGLALAAGALAVALPGIVPARAADRVIASSRLLNAGVDAYGGKLVWSVARGFHDDEGL